MRFLRLPAVPRTRQLTLRSMCCTAWYAVGVLALSGVASCGRDSAPGDSAPGPVADGPRAPAAAEWAPPAETDIPADSLGASIRRGLALLRFTPESLPRYATSNLRCTSCHEMDGRKVTAGPLTGTHARFPKYLGRTGAVIDLADRVNYCFTRSLAGNALPVDSREMQDILAYIAFLSRGLPVGAKIPGADGLPPMRDKLIGDAVHGEQVFTRECVVCHLASGEGQATIPALWGPKSYSIGASMAREERAASFIWHNMPLTKPGSLSPQDAFDLAAFINAHPRPDSPGKELDWPAGDAPADVPYDTRGHQAHRPPAHLVPRLHAASAVVPRPQPAPRD